MCDNLKLVCLLTVLLVSPLVSSCAPVEETEVEAELEAEDMGEEMEEDVYEYDEDMGEEMEEDAYEYDEEMEEGMEEHDEGGGRLGRGRNGATGRGGSTDRTHPLLPVAAATADHAYGAR